MSDNYPTVFQEREWIVQRPDPKHVPPTPQAAGFFSRDEIMTRYNLQNDRELDELGSIGFPPPAKASYAPLQQGGGRTVFWSRQAVEKWDAIMAAYEQRMGKRAKFLGMF